MAIWPKLRRVGFHNTLGKKLQFHLTMNLRKLALLDNVFLIRVLGRIGRAIDDDSIELALNGVQIVRLRRPTGTDEDWRRLRIGRIKRG